MHPEMTLALICGIHLCWYLYPIRIGFCVGGQLVTSGYFALDSSRILAHLQCLDLLLPEL
ncbi:hypothetical protein PISMIDRAFT_322207 [Pisolithus microcarpus 441]|uniref:Unplaced genomic scaffold scaffold_205, whole genome shotgun sequence n=1 Tax=Pisolithus microcarpus 441 TaxID=765257 RepID=A0A0C9YZH5_9AGAM|nr:hypothetical protein PISMIDRAFT_322207 [Pisolithus microcarpus 441]